MATAEGSGEPITSQQDDILSNEQLTEGSDIPIEVPQGDIPRNELLPDASYTNTVSQQDTVPHTPQLVDNPYTTSTSHQYSFPGNLQLNEDSYTQTNFHQNTIPRNPQATYTGSQPDSRARHLDLTEMSDTNIASRQGSEPSLEISDTHIDIQQHDSMPGILQLSEYDIHRSSEKEEISENLHSTEFSFLHGPSKQDVTFENIETTEDSNTSPTSQHDSISGKEQSTEGLDIPTTSQHDSIFGREQSTEGLDIPTTSQNDSIFGKEQSTEGSDIPTSQHDSISGKEQSTEGSDILTKSQNDSIFGREQSTEGSDIPTTSQHDSIFGREQSTEGSDIHTTSQNDSISRKEQSTEGSDIPTTSQHDSISGKEQSTEGSDIPTSSQLDSMLGKEKSIEPPHTDSNPQTSDLQTASQRQSAPSANLLSTEDSNIKIAHYKSGKNQVSDPKNTQSTENSMTDATKTSQPIATRPRKKPNAGESVNSREKLPVRKHTTPKEQDSTRSYHQPTVASLGKISDTIQSPKLNQPKTGKAIAVPSSDTFHKKQAIKQATEGSDISRTLQYDSTHGKEKSTVPSHSQAHSNLKPSETQAAYQQQNAPLAKDSDIQITSQTPAEKHDVGHQIHQSTEKSKTQARKTSQIVKESKIGRPSESQNLKARKQKRSDSVNKQEKLPLEKCTQLKEQVETRSFQRPTIASLSKSCEDISKKTHLHTTQKKRDATCRNKQIESKDTPIKDSRRASKRKSNVPTSSIQAPASRHLGVIQEATAIRDFWIEFAKTLGMEKYFPAKLNLMEIRKLYVRKDVDCAPLEKDVLPWLVLEKLMFMNFRCCEDAIKEFSKTVKPNKEVTVRKVFGESIFQTTETIPHPMDIILLLFTCSDYMLRQVLARKLFLCRLAIPFIIPTAEDKVEMLMWPLRSIVLEWRDSYTKDIHEEALVNCKFNMVACVRYGNAGISKSSLMNDVLSSSSHTTFFHKESPGGNMKRLISNGTVEMSHYLPGSNQQELFKDPALFFNLRGDACDYPVQHSVLLDLATVVVIFVDIGELREASVEKMLKSTTRQRQLRTLFVHTNSKGHRGNETEELYKLFCDTIDGSINNEDMVRTFEMDGSRQNKSSIVENVRRVISKKMDGKSTVSLEKYVSSRGETKLLVDELSNRDCSSGKDMADRIWSDIDRVNYLKRKKELLPKQSSGLSRLGKLLREIHQSSARDYKSTKIEIEKREARVLEMNKIREEHAKVTGNESFMDQIFRLLQEKKEPRDFAIRFLQLQLDSRSRLHLPRLHREKDALRKQIKMNNECDSDSVPDLKKKIRDKETEISAATFGWEHLMREVGQVYEVQAAVKEPNKDVSFLADLVGRRLKEGHPVELMDGDHGVLHLAWVKAVFNSLSDLVGEKNRIFVVSVVGVQSSGKSTLLNTMFGSEFDVSAGRCTRGIYAQLLPAKDEQNLPFDYLLVLDSEGLRSQQNEHYHHDNELATLVIGLSDLTLINVMGENVTEMMDVLAIVVAAFLRMKLADSLNKRRCKIIHQNVEDVGAYEKLADGRQRLEEKLDAMTKQASDNEGHAQRFTSFNEIIGFNSQKDVVYFPGLWHGEQPMVALRPGYSHCAADMQQKLLQHIQEEFTTSITILDFITRVEDMWKGVLSDDFIFSFRNTLAIKVYYEVEKEYSAQTIKIEQELSEWVTKDWKGKIEKCRSEESLEECHSKFKPAATTKINALVERHVQVLQEFCENHHASEIVAQWKDDKVKALHDFGKTQLSHTVQYLKNLQQQKKTEIHYKKAFKSHEKDMYIYKKAMVLAETMRDKGLLEKDIKEQFEELWEKLTAEIPMYPTSMKSSVKDAFQSILSEKFRLAGDMAVKCFTEETNRTPLTNEEILKPLNHSDLHKDHIFMKPIPAPTRTGMISFKPSSENYLGEALMTANSIMETVMQKVEVICSEEKPFSNAHGRDIIDHLWKNLEHNELEAREVPFGMTMEFRALLAVRVTCCAISKFEQMNRRYENQYGIEAIVQSFKERKFQLFRNTVRQESDEFTASVDFCEVLKAKITEHVWDDVNKTIRPKICSDLGDRKSELIIRMLKEIADEGDFKLFQSYATDPAIYANDWVTQYCKRCLFEARNMFMDLSARAIQKIVSEIRSSVEAAVQAVSVVEPNMKYDRWKEEFCTTMKTFHINSDDLEMTKECIVKNFTNFQELVRVELAKMEEVVQQNFQQETAESATKLESTYVKIFQQMWGCRLSCPFCKEPCQNSCQKEDRCDHRCVQHKPPGIRGIGTRNLFFPDTLYTETCNWFVASEEKFWCLDVNGECRADNRCKERFWNRLAERRHKYQSYKKYFPHWDIPSDASGEAGKYWQWAVCYFEKDLNKKYPERKLVIPESWRKVRKKEAIKSLKGPR